MQCSECSRPAYRGTRCWYCERGVRRADSSTTKTRKVRTHNSELRTATPPDDDEPTEAELDAIIAEQRQNLPDWWQADTLMMRARRTPGGD